MRYVCREETFDKGCGIDIPSGSIQVQIAIKGGESVVQWLEPHTESTENIIVWGMEINIYGDNSLGSKKRNDYKCKI